MKYYDRCWNPLFGCRGDFAGCDKCYAKTLMERRGRIWTDFHKVQPNRKQLYRKFEDTPQLIAVCTQSDLFQGENGADRWIVDTVLSKCDANRQNHYLFLTKFASNLREYFNDDGLLKRLNGNHLVPFDFGTMAFGVSVCCNADLHRLDELRETKHIQHKFVAFEPLLEEIPVTTDNLAGMEWVILGGETGENPTYCKQEWLVEIVMVADSMGIPVFVNAVHTEGGKVTTEFGEMNEALRDIPFARANDTGEGIGVENK